MNLIDFDHNFYGRRSVFEVLKKRVLGLKEGYRQNVALLGNRYIGKTALLHRLISQMEEQGLFLSIWTLRTVILNIFPRNSPKACYIITLKRKCHALAGRHEITLCSC